MSLIHSSILSSLLIMVSNWKRRNVSNCCCRLSPSFVFSFCFKSFLRLFDGRGIFCSFDGGNGGSFCSFDWFGGGRAGGERLATDGFFSFGLFGVSAGASVVDLIFFFLVRENASLMLSVLISSFFFLFFSYLVYSRAERIGFFFSPFLLCDLLSWKNRFFPFLLWRVIRE